MERFDEVRDRIRNVVAIPVTPLSEAGEVDYDALREVIERITAAGIVCLTPNGNTSEFYALTPHEIAASLRIVAEASGTAALIPGVGLDVRTAMGQAEDAAALGAIGVMVHQPVHPFQSAAGWIRYHELIAECVPELGVIPYVRSKTISREMIAELADRCPNVVGVKYAVPDVLRLADAVGNVNAPVVWVCGLAESWAPFFWLAGARGFTSGLANVEPAVSLALLEALRSMDVTRAMLLWAEIRRFEELRARNGDANNVSVVKEAMAQRGFCGRRVRAPISELTDQERTEVAAAIAALDKAPALR